MVVAGAQLCDPVHGEAAVQHFLTIDVCDHIPDLDAGAGRGTVLGHRYHQQRLVARCLRRH